MNVFFPIGSFYPAQSGGPNNTIYWLGKNLVKNGVEVTVLTTNNGIKENHNIQFDKWNEIDGIKTKYLTTKIHQFPLKLLFQSINQIRKADVVHLNSLFYFPSFLLGFVCALMRKRVVWSVRGELHDEALKFSPGLKKIMLSCLKVFAGKKFVFHGTSEEELKHISKKLNRQPVYAANYIELPTKFEIPLENKISFLGRIHPIKSLHKLIEGASLSEEFKNQKTNLIITGFENKVGYLKELTDLAKRLNIANQIKINNPLSGNEKYQFLASSKFKFLVSESENFGNVIIESLSQGTPVIASKGTPWQVLNDKEAGFWIDNDPQSIAKIIDSALTMPAEEYLKMRANAFNLVKGKYDISEMYKVWLDIYNKLMT